MTETDELLEISKSAEILKVKDSWFYQNIHAGTLPFSYVKIGRYVRIKRSDLMNYIERSTRPAGK